MTNTEVVQMQVTVRSKKMTDKCMNCGNTEAQTTADAKTLGFLQELQSGVYTCCQISEWTHEQWLAWFEARQEDSKRVNDVARWPEFDDSQVVFVPVRRRRQQAPWYRNSDDVS
jgi:hypothetical protein